MHDPDLHLFISDDEIFAIRHLKPMVQTWRKDGIEPVLVPDGAEEGTGIGYASAIRDPEDDRIKLWYSTHSDALIRLAVSEDGRSWTKHGVVMDGWPKGTVDNLHVTVPTEEVDLWFRNARFVGTAYFGPTEREKGYEAGIYGMRSLDGERWEVRLPAILPKIGDRSALTLDAHRGVYLLTSRPPSEISNAVKASKVRKISLWESRDLVHWEERGIVLRADENDEEDVQLYGMVPFRYGAGFLGLLEMYDPDIERLDTQLAYSPDGLHWQRVRRREPVLPRGGEGGWDSHWVVPTLNPPLMADNRLIFFYTGGSTKHGSKKRHRRAIGIASLRRDGWVSLEAGRTEGQVVTTVLPLSCPMQLEVNVSCPTGYCCAEVLYADGTPMEEYSSDPGRLEAVDVIRHRISWEGRTTVSSSADGLCRLRFTLFQGSLFSYRWSKVGG
jgi:hypothetical protein